MAVLVRDRMCRHVVTVSPDDTVSKAVKSMADNDIGCIVVCRKEKPLGILTERDVVKKVVASGTDPNSTKVSDVMTRKLIGLESGKTVQEAAVILEKRKIKRLPVIEGGKLVGIITMTDLIGSMREIEKEESDSLRQTVKELHLTKIRLQSRIIDLEDRLVRK